MPGVRDEMAGRPGAVLPEPKQARSRRTRDALLRAAEDGFAATGWRETSVEQIAAAAGVSVGTLYTRFRTKQDLLWAVAERCVARINELALTVDDLTVDPAGSLRGLLEIAVTRRRENAGLLRAWAECGIDHSDVREQQAAVRNALLRQVALLLSRLSGVPGARPDLDPGAVAVAVVGVLDGIHQPPWTELDTQAAVTLCWRMLGPLIFVET